MIKTLPFLKTDLKSDLWRGQLTTGIIFTFFDKSTFMVRQMNEQDISDVFQLEQTIFSDPWSISAFRMILKDTKYYLAMVGTINNNLVAYGISQCVADQLHIHNLAVDPQYRRNGYGTTLLWLILEIASNNNIKICHLEVRRSNFPALSLYHKFGFEIIGMRKQYYFKDNEDALLMTKYI